MLLNPKNETYQFWDRSKSDRRRRRRLSVERRENVFFSILVHNKGFNCVFIVNEAQETQWKCFFLFFSGSEPSVMT